uniref:Protein kinase domain-containing protein n=1 Tax=viral metagenome TaxID=1070528 RepID=A0A6C0BAB0_9ZZZZ
MLVTTLPHQLQTQTQKRNSFFPKTIQSLIRRTSLSLNNIALSNYIIQIIPHYHNYFLPIESHKNVTFDNNKTEFILITRKQLHPTSSSYSVDSNTNNERKAMHSYFNSLKTLLEICSIMQQYKFIHLNIQKNTIHYIHDIPYIHDFSRSFLFKSLTGERKAVLFQSYNPAYIHLPPSYHILCYITQNGLKSPGQGTIDYILQEYINHAIQQGIAFSEKDSFQFRESWTYYLSNNQQIVEDCTSWDAYSVLLLYIQQIPVTKQYLSYLEKIRNFLIHVVLCYPSYSLHDIRILLNTLIF